MRAKQEFGRKVTDYANVLLDIGLNRVHPTLHQAIANRRGDRQVVIERSRPAWIAALLVNQAIDKGALQVFNIQAGSGVLVFDNFRNGSGVHGGHFFSL